MPTKRKASTKKAAASPKTAPKRQKKATPKGSAKKSPATGSAKKTPGKGSGPRIAERVVSISYDDLKKGKDLSDLVMEAYGPNGLGALVITGIPGYAEARKKLIPLSWNVAHLPEEDRKALEHEASMYNAGWSHGKEKLGDKPDFAKGSFYANPCYDSPGTKAQLKKYPFFYPENIWPTQSLPALEPAFKQCGSIMFDTVKLLAKQVDSVCASRVKNYPAGLLEKNIGTTKKIKGRVLYYFPVQEKKGKEKEDGWIGWHNDSGFFTALTSDMFFDDDTGEHIPNPDPAGGLWIVDRAGGSVKVNIPEDALAVQCGECLQIVTGGLLVATPHCVKASRAPPGQKVGRGTFPVFIDTGVDFKLSAPKGVSREDVFANTMDSRVPPLADRWLKNGTPFVEFLGTTFRKYYEHTIALQKGGSGGDAM